MNPHASHHAHHAAHGPDCGRGHGTGTRAIAAIADPLKDSTPEAIAALRESADVGIAMGTGTDVAMESAGVTLVKGAG